MKRKIALFVATAMALMVLMGSGVFAQEDVTIEVWYAISGSSGDSLQAIIKDFEALNTGIKLNCSYSGGYSDTATKITAALQSNTTPDVLIGGMPAYTGGYGNFYAGEMVKADPEFDYDDVFVGLWDYAMYDGEVCNIPFGISTPLMFYNRALLEGTGIDLENNPPQTWDDFVEVCKELKDYHSSNSNFVPFVVKDRPWLFKTQLRQVGNEVIHANEDYSVKTAAFGAPETAAVAAWWQTMAKEGLTTVGDHGNAENVFLAGMAAFFSGSSTKISAWTELFGDDLRAIPMPYFTQPAVSLGGNTVSIFPSKNQAKTDAAWEFVKYITSTQPNTKFAINSGYLPIRQSALALPEIQEAFDRTPAYKTAYLQLEHAFSYVNIDSFSALDNAIVNAIDKVTEDLKYDPARAMREAAVEYDLEAEGR